MFDKFGYYLKKSDYSSAVNKLESYKSELEDCVREIRSQLEILKTAGEGSNTFYGEVCRNFMKKTNILCDDLNSMVFEMEKRISIIDERISQAKTAYEKYNELYENAKLLEV